MSKKEQTKLIILDRFIKDETTLTEAAALLGISFRQATRLRDRYRADGATGLVHRSRGVPSRRATDADMRQRLAEFANAKLCGHRSTHFADLLAWYDKQPDLFIREPTLLLSERLLTTPKVFTIS